MGVTKAQFPRTRRTVVATPGSDPTAPPLPNVPPLPGGAAAVAASEGVLVDVPHKYRLTLDDGVVVDVAAGRQVMPRAIAEHWYSAAHGVVMVDAP